MTSGMQFGCMIDGKGGGIALNPGAENAQPPAEGLVWMHFDYKDEAAGRWLRQESGIDPIAVDALLDEDSRPRMVDFPHGLMVILRGVNFNEGSRPEDMVSVRIWLEDNRIITTRRRRVRSPYELYQELLDARGPHDPGDFLVRLAERLDSHIEPVVDTIEDEIEEAEAAYGEAEPKRYGGEFGAMRRKTARLRRYLAPQRDTLERLSRHGSPLLTEEQRNRLREEADAITRVLEDLDLARERAMVAQEELLNRMAQEQNGRMYVLSLVAAIFLPLGFLTGLMGMNVAGLPGTDNPAAFATLTVLMTGLAVGILVLFRWKKWF